MKTTGAIEAATGLWYSLNTGATNSSGFSAAPGGFRGYNGDYFDFGYSCYLWSSSEYGTNDAWYRNLFYSNAFAGRFYVFKQDGFSVRCLRD